MKWVTLVLMLVMLGVAACGDTAPTTTSPAASSTASTHANAPAVVTPTPTLERHPLPIDRIADALIGADDVEGGSRFWTQEESSGDNIWGIGLCGKASGPAPVSQLTRRFVADPSSIYHNGWLIESILVFAPGDAAKFMEALRAAIAPCDAELRTSGRALFENRLPRIRNESVTFNLESFSCCVTPLPTDSQQPHDIVYIRDGDIVLHLYASIDVVEPAARRAEDRLDGLPPRP
jgi:hypothetical protein